MSKVIFLDIDGVLNRHDERYYTREKSPMGFVGVGQKHLLQLKRIVDATGAELVLSSDWKMCFYSDGNSLDNPNEDGAYLMHRLEENGMRLIAKTDDRSVGDDHSTGRGYGIRKYLKAHQEVTNYVILDDCYFADFNRELIPHLVHLEYPLTKRSADKAIKILQQ